MSNPSGTAEHRGFTDLGEQFQAAMDPKSRHQQGAHYTRETALLRIIGPTIIQPFQAQIDTAQDPKELRAVLDDLRIHRVLDPSCGSGNFLYAAFRGLRALEDQILHRLRDLGASDLEPQVGLHQLYGLDRDAAALKVARTVLSAAQDTHGGVASEPHLTCGDALFMDWPAVDCIVGNPPFQSKNKRQQEWGAETNQALQTAFPEVPGRADYCVYFLRKAHDHLNAGQRAGFVGTNTIRENDSRVGGLDYIVQHGGTLVAAVANQPWDGDAVVFVSIVNWIKGSQPGPYPLHWQTRDGTWHQVQVPRIPPSLSPLTDVTQAKPLTANRKPKRVFQGQTHGHAGFLLSPKEAAKWHEDPRLRAFIHPFMNGKDLLNRGTNSRFVIDIPFRTEAELRPYTRLHAYLKTNVFPSRQAAAEKESARNATVTGSKGRLNHHHQNFFKRWWALSYARHDLIEKLGTHARYIACSRVTRYPVFCFVDANIHPSDAVTVFDFSDEYSFGVLQSKWHTEWFRARCSTLGIGLRYTSNTVFDAFPWPQAPTAAQIERVKTSTTHLLACRQDALNEGVNSLTTLYAEPPEALRAAHDALDEAVGAAYGFEDVLDPLSSLLALNLRCFDKERAGQRIRGPGTLSR